MTAPERGEEVTGESQSEHDRHTRAKDAMWIRPWWETDVRKREMKRDGTVVTALE